MPTGKPPQENFGGDGYHITSTHGSARELGVDTTTSQTRQWNKGCQISCGNGHILVSWITPPDSGPWFAQPDDQLVAYMKEHAKEIENRLGAKRARQIAPSAGTVFPNLSVHWLTRTIRVWQPRGPDKMEIWSWAIVDKAASAKIKDVMRFVSQFRFSPSGVFEQDDMDNWIQVTSAARSLIGRRHPANYQMSGNEPPLEIDLPGTVTSRFSDNNQLSLYMHWAKMLQAKSWNRVADHPKWLIACAEKSKIFITPKRSFWIIGNFGNGSHCSRTISATGCRYATTRSSASNDLKDELAKPGEAFYFDDDKASLRIRVERVYARNAWAEMPPSRTRHLITNVRIKSDDGSCRRSAREFFRVSHAYGNRSGCFRGGTAGYFAPHDRKLSDRPHVRSFWIKQCCRQKNISVFL
jgi:hypothetical protein